MTEPDLIPPGYYTVRVKDEKSMEIVEGPYKGRTIFARLPTFTAKITQENLNVESIRNAGHITSANV